MSDNKTTPYDMTLPASMSDNKTTPYDMIMIAQEYIDNLRAEIERLNAYADRMERWARAEQEERYKAEDQRTDLRAEVARLKHLHNLDHSLADQREAQVEAARAALKDADAAGMALVKENERLRDALEQIAGIDCADPEFNRRLAINALADLEEAKRVR